MDFGFTDAQRARREETLAFARRELGAELRDHDRAGTFPRADWDRCGAFGVLASHVPKQFGGRGDDTVTTVATLEAVGEGCRDNGLTLAMGGQVWSVQEPILTYGSDAQKQRFLPDLCAGRRIGAHAVSEPGAGSDALSLETTAVRRSGGYVLNGDKAFIGMAPVADVALVLANTQPEAGKWGVSAFLVETDTDGCARGGPRPKTGTRTNPIGTLTFRDCFVPEANRLGGEGIGVSLMSYSIGWERAFIHAGHLGALRALLDRSVAYAKDRRQFGRPIGSYQAVSHRLADMRLRLETSRLLMYQAATLKDAGADATLECALANLHIAESLLASATDAVRVHGARGYLEEYEIERDLRDAVGGVLYAGTSDIQRNLVARLMGLP